MTAVKEESEEAGLKLNIQKTKIMASGPITSWQIDGETVADFILGGSKITADGDCSHEIKRRGCISSPCLFNFYAEYIMWNARLAESWAEIKISWNNINNLRYADGTTLMAESKEELKSLESEREERKSWLESQCSKN